MLLATVCRCMNSSLMFRSWGAIGVPHVSNLSIMQFAGNANKVKRVTGMLWWLLESICHHWFCFVVDNDFLLGCCLFYGKLLLSKVYGGCRWMLGVCVGVCVCFVNRGGMFLQTWHDRFVHLAAMSSIFCLPFTFYQRAWALQYVMVRIEWVSFWFVELVL